MLRCIILRFALPAVVAVTLLPASAQSQDTQSVAEAARKARAQKKNPEKPAKVITDETLDVKKGDVQNATAEQPRIPGSTENQAQPAAGAANTQSGASGNASANAPGSKNASPDDKARAALKERVALKEKIKDAQSDLDLLQREYQLDQDSFYSNPNNASDTSGKEKLDAMKQRISDKQQELEQLKAKLAALSAAQDNTGTTPKS